MKDSPRLLTLLLALCLACDAGRTRETGLQPDGCRLGRDGSVVGKLHAVCEHLAERWTALAGEPAPPGEIRLEERRGFQNMTTDSGWVLLWPTPEAGRSEHTHNLLNIIPHEAAHVVFEASRPTLVRVPGINSYSSASPDWLDEAAAVWGESETLRTQRLARIHGARPSLAFLLTATHPGIDILAANARTSAEYEVIMRTVLPPCGAPCTWIADSLRGRYQITDVRAHTDGRVDTLTTWQTDQPTGWTHFETREFYPLAYSLLAFINERGGPDAFHALVARYAADPTPRADALNGLPGLPDSFEEIERAWHAFLATPR